MAKGKANKSQEFHFKAKLSPVQVQFVSTIIYIPDKIADSLPRERLRTKGTINGASFSLAIQYRKNGPSFFIVSAPLRKVAKIKAGDTVEVKFKVVSDKVELPEELEAVLAQDDEGMKVWKTFKPGKQRSLSYYVNSAKNIDTRVTRALQLVEKMKTGQLYTQISQRKKQRSSEDEA
jgi:hypothetical protein